MLTRIRKALDDIERKDTVRILFSCESGSRAWGFSSPESDFDVRFLYVHPEARYSSLTPVHCRDVIERPIEDRLDIGGWDLGKALRLFCVSNPPLLEWLHSPVVYLDRFGAAGEIRSFIPEYFSPEVCRRHYLRMAVRNIRKYLSRKDIVPKRCFYILRPLLAVRWLDEGRGLVPVRFSELLEVAADDPAFISAVRDLLLHKRSGGEMEQYPLHPAILGFVEREIVLRQQIVLPGKPSEPNMGKLNGIFRELVFRAWHGQCFG